MFAGFGPVRKSITCANFAGHYKFILHKKCHPGFLRSHNLKRNEQ